MQEFSIPIGKSKKEDVEKGEDSEWMKPKKEMFPPSQASKLTDRGKVDTVIKPINSSSRLNKVVLILSFFAALFFCLTVIFAYLYFFKEPEPIVEEETEESTSDNESSSILGGRIVYTDGYNIFWANKSGRESEKLTDYDDTSEISEIELVDNDKLGYIRCLVDDTGCSILLLKITTKETEQVKVFKQDSSVIQLSWLDARHFAYTVEDMNSQKLTLTYVKENEESKFSVMNYAQGSRKTFVEDDAQISFSPDGDKFYFVNTKALNGFNFVVTVYDLTGSVVATIEDATNPVWADNDSIIYRSYSNESQVFLREFDLASGVSSELTKSKEASYSPEVYNEKLLFWEASGLGKSYMLDLENAEVTEITGNSAFPIWLSESEVILASTKECTNDCNLYNEKNLGFTVESFKVVNLEDGTETSIDLELEDLHKGILTLNNVHI